ncbi:MAG: 50S ribosomal protein L18 [Planctomycetota bacterium]
MDKHRTIELQRARRRGHTRRIIRGTTVRPRLSVYRSNRHISAQIIDDEQGKTLAAASTLQKEVVEGLKSTSSREAAQKVGAVLAGRAKEAGVNLVAFDRGHYKYHGRVAALATGAREGGLQF